MKRDLKLDSLKGFLIILVVYGHMPFEFFSIERSSLLNNISSFIYFFHMPLFLGVSVIFIKPSYEWLIKRTTLILVPYVFWFSYKNIFLLRDDTGLFFEKMFMANYDSIESIFWFLPALLSLNILVFLCYFLNKFMKFILIISSLLVFVFSREIVLLHSFIPFGLDIVLYVFILTYLIKLLYENRNLIEKCSFLILMIMVFISSFLVFYFEPIKTHSEWHMRIDLAQFSVPITTAGYISFITLNVTIFLIFMRMKSNGLLAFIGTYSFPIFIMHLWILYILPLQFKFDNNIMNLSFILITFIFSITGPIILSKGLMKLSEKLKYIGLVK